MQKKYALISIAVILLVSCGVYFQFFYKHIDVDRIEAGDSLKILTTNTADMLKTLQELKGYKNLNRGQQMKADDKMGGCIMLTLMKLPEISDENFNYYTLTQKATTVHEAIVKHQTELTKSFEDCFKELPQDVRQIIEAGGV